MSINMSNVKSITLGGVSVKKIEDTNGRVLWGGSTTATINLTVGAGQDITTTQYYNRIVLPSLSTIKSKVASKTGISQSSINITKVKLDLSTLYWYNPYDSNDFRNAKATTSSSVDSGTTVLVSNYTTTKGVHNWIISIEDVTNYLGKTLYGYYKGASGYTAFGNYSSSNSGNFCKSGNSTVKPIFTIIVTYES